MRGRLVPTTEIRTLLLERLQEKAIKAHDRNHQAQLAPLTSEFINVTASATILRDNTPANTARRQTLRRARNYLLPTRD